MVNDRQIRIARFCALLACIGLCLVIAGCRDTGSGNDDAKVVAIIDGRRITSEMLEWYLYENLNGIFPRSFLKDFEQNEQDADRVKSRLFEDFLDEQLLLGEAIKAGIAVSDEEVTDFLKAFGERATDGEGHRKRNFDIARDLLIVQKFKSEKLLPRVMVGESELKQYYDEQSKETGSTQIISMSIIRFETEEDAQKAANDIRRGKEKFEELLKQHPSGRGGDEPQEYDINDLPEDIRDGIRKLKVGQVSDAMPLLGQYCIIRIEGMDRGTVKPFEEVADALREKLFREKLQTVLRQYMEDLKKRTDVEVFYENLPFTFVREEQ